jgi:predicted outer membrane protein
MKMSHSFTTLKLLTLAAALSTTALLVDAQERTRTPTDATGAATTESTRGVQAAGGDADQAQRNANATKSMAAKAVQTDGQILQIVRSLNDAEIKQAKFVMDESDNTELKVVAQSIINDHEDSNEKIDDLVEGDLSLDDSPLNDTLSEQAEATFEMLDELEGSQLDCQYLQAQVEQHELVIDTAKNDLLPDAKSPAVQAFLTESAPKLEHHLMSAKDAMKGMSGCAQASNQGAQGNLGSQQNRSGTAPATPNRSTTPTTGERQ